MIEKTIYLEGIEPINIFGVNNSNFDVIKQFFPKIKIVARGNEIKAIGEKNEIVKFEEKIERLIEYYYKYNNLNKDAIEKIAKGNSGSIEKSDDIIENLILYGNEGRLIKAKTTNQIRLVKESEIYDLIFAIGPAGTGKTYTAIALSIKALKNKAVKRIILTRPAVEAGENLGFLPGDLKEKLDPYLQPLYDALNDMVPPKRLRTYFEDGTIQIAPLAYMRGRTLNNAFVILDEAQNATANQLKMFLTRMGRNVKFIVTGDLTQIDLLEKHNSGLLQSRRILGKIKGISFIYFDQGDIIRHDLVKQIVAAYEKNENNNSKK